MGMPDDVGIVDTMIGFPHPDMKEVYRFITRQTKDTRVEGGLRVPRRVHVQGRARERPDRLRRPHRRHPARDGPLG